MTSIGIDLVEIERFQRWHTYSDKQLRKIFSEQEIVYCRSISSKSAERFAVRFAAKEALFKALAPLYAKPIPLLTLCSNAELTVRPTGVVWNVRWQAFAQYAPGADTSKITISTSLSHTHTTACAVVIITLLP